MSVTLEIAFDMIESTYLSGDLKIVGVYEAPVITPSDPISTLAMSVISQIKATGHFSDVCAVNVVSKIAK